MQKVLIPALSQDPTLFVGFGPLRERFGALHNTLSRVFAYNNFE